MSNAHPSLSDEQLAIIFSQLQRLESAGQAPFQAYAFLPQSDTRLKRALALMQRQLKSGQPISEAGFQAGIFSDTQKTLIHAAEDCGRLAEIYGQLARYYTELSRRRKKVKSRLYFPALILVFSLFVQPLPALISSEISAIDFLQLTLGRMVVLGAGVSLLVQLPEILRRLGAEAEWHRLQLAIPVFSGQIINRQVNGFLVILAMMLETGMPFADALPKAVASIKNTRLREQFKPALMMIGSGASVADMLAKVPSIGARILHIIDSSEQSGKLASSILHFTQLEADAISRQDDALAEWLPRLVYGILAIWLAYSILGSHVVAA